MAERPRAAKILSRRERHHKHGHEKVGEGQRHDEPVGDSAAQRFVLGDNDDDEQVAEEGGHHDHSEDQDHDHAGPDREHGRCGVRPVRTQRPRGGVTADVRGHRPWLCTPRVVLTAHLK